MKARIATTLTVTAALLLGLWAADWAAGNGGPPEGNIDQFIDRLQPGKTDALANVVLRDWRLTDAKEKPIPLDLQPGKHKVQVFCPLEQIGTDASGSGRLDELGGSRGIEISSNPVEIEILPADAKPAAQRLPAASKPTAETLEKWLEGKDVVEVWFAGPRIEPQKLKDSLQTQGIDTASDETFLFTPGEGGGVGSFVEVEMNASPKNIQRLLSLQKELATRGYPLEPGHARVWSYQCDAETRKQVQDMVPKVLRELTAKIEKTLPNAKVGDETSRPSGCLGAIKYEVPGTPIRGNVLVYPINPRKRWYLPTQPDQRFHLPHLGLMITAYYRAQQPGARSDASPEHANIRKTVMEAMEPLIKLDGGADIRCGSSTSPIRMCST
jgi:hypothetical protein